MSESSPFPPVRLDGSSLSYRDIVAIGVGDREVELDPAALKRYRVDYDTVATPRHLYRYVRADGEVTYYACSKQDLHHVYPKDAQPISEPGSRLDVVPDDGTAAFEKLYEEAALVPVKRNEKKR